jgi:hypothetical protein
MDAGEQRDPRDPERRSVTPFLPFSVSLTRAHGNCYGRIRTYNHAWVCLGTNQCAGLMPLSDIPKSLCLCEGQIQSDEFDSTKCRAMDVDGQTGCDQTAYEACIQRNLARVGENQKFSGICANCVAWARRLILHCQAKACGQNPEETLFSFY